MSPLPEPEPPVDGCPKCGMFGCDCEVPKTVSPYSAPHQRLICVACHRTTPCLCKSNLERPNLKTAQTGEPVPAVTPEQKADQDMDRFWFERDPAGLRRHLVQLYSSIDRMHKA